MQSTGTMHKVGTGVCHRDIATPFGGLPSSLIVHAHTYKHARARTDTFAISHTHTKAPVHAHTIACARTHAHNSFSLNQVCALAKDCFETLGGRGHVFTLRSCLLRCHLYARLVVDVVQAGWWFLLGHRRFAARDHSAQDKISHNPGWQEN